MVQTQQASGFIEYWIVSVTVAYTCSSSTLEADGEIMSLGPAQATQRDLDLNKQNIELHLVHGFLSPTDYAAHKDL